MSEEYFAEKLRRLKADFDCELQDFSLAFYDGQDPLHAACRYALAGEGKRTRPILVILVAELFEGNFANALPAALAVEWVHTYSLIHDDLPTLDNDDLRRGRYTVHRQFDEATALLAGDALLSDAFGILSNKTNDLSLVRELSSAIGGRGMVLGQMLDVYWTNRTGLQSETVTTIEKLKTGFLLAAATAMGARSGRASEDDVLRLRKFGELLGIAFQLVDDTIDELPGTGKSQAKDRLQGKPSILQIESVDSAIKIANQYCEQAMSCLEPYGEKGQLLGFYARSLLKRKT